MLPFLGIITIAYLLGSIPFGIIAARLAGILDIRKHGSGNIGATNVGRVAGMKAALMVYAGDIGKGMLAVATARFVASGGSLGPIPFDTVLVSAAAAVIAGHIFPVYIGFKGGKGVNTLLGALLIIKPVEALIAVACFLVVLAVTRFVSAGSILGITAFLTTLLVERFLLKMPVPYIYIVIAGLMTLVILVTHRDNIRRILSGAENRFSWPRGAGKAGGNV